MVKNQKLRFCVSRFAFLRFNVSSFLWPWLKVVALTMLHSGVHMQEATWSSKHKWGEEALHSSIAMHLKQNIEKVATFIVQNRSTSWSRIYFHHQKQHRFWCLSFYRRLKTMENMTVDGDFERKEVEQGKAKVQQDIEDLRQLSRELKAALAAEGKSIK